MREAKPTVVNIATTKPKAKEQLMMVLLILLTVVEFILLQICKILESIRAELGTN